MASIGLGLVQGAAPACHLHDRTAPSRSEGEGGSSGVELEDEPGTVEPGAADPRSSTRAADGPAAPAASSPLEGERATREGPSAGGAVAEPDRADAQERPAVAAEERWLAEARERMVRDQIEARGVEDPRVLEAMREVQRHLLVPEPLIRVAYADHPLPIGRGQTISQPYIVALMSELLQVTPGEKVLEVGTGSGYQAAVLSAMGAEVWTVEIVEPLGVEAKRRLEEMGYARIRFKIGDGYRGWPEAAPFDGIIVTAAPDHVPQPLVDQLAPRGRLVIPVGSGEQELLVLTRSEKGVVEERSIPVRFVPMTGEAEERGP